MVDVIDRQLPALSGLGVPPDLVTVLVGSNDVLRRELSEERSSESVELLQSAGGAG